MKGGVHRSAAPPLNHACIAPSKSELLSFSSAFFPLLHLLLSFFWQFLTHICCQLISSTHPSVRCSFLSASVMLSTNVFPGHAPSFLFSCVSASMLAPSLCCSSIHFCTPAVSESEVLLCCCIPPSSFQLISCSL